MTRIAVVDGLAPERYLPHALHAAEAAWVEKNCYVDLWIELLHTLRLDPLACLPSTLAIDFEGDQWTFFKPPHGELRDLYGIDVQELTVWRPLIDHAVEHLAAGKWVSTEADAYWLPDTVGTDYRRQHTKTTIVLNDIDVHARRLGYFHNAGYFRLEGEDFARLFRLDAPGDETFLPLFAELVKVDRVVRHERDELVARSRASLRRHLAQRPAIPPIPRFRTRLEQDLPGLRAAGLATYHRWAFAGIRQLGAAFELAAAHLDWLGDDALRPAAADFSQIADGSKALIMKAARAVNSGRPMDVAAAFEGMAQAWERGMALLDLRA